MTSEASSQCLSKREDYIGWKEYFMGIALLAAKRSKDPSRQVGACIVGADKIIVGIGYNGMPIGCHDDDFPWSKNKASYMENKHLYVCHAEMNAIRNANTADLKNTTMYVSLFPCNECAKMIIQWGIKKVIYLSNDNAERDQYKASQRMLRTARVMYKQYKITSNKILIEFKSKGKKNKFPIQDVSRKNTQQAKDYEDRDEMVENSDSTSDSE